MSSKKDYFFIQLSTSAYFKKRPFFDLGLQM